MLNPSTYSSAERPASPSPVPVCDEDWTTRVAIWPSSFAALLIDSGRGMSSGKTSPVPCHRAEDGTLVPSSGRWSNSGMACAGESWTLSISESPSGAVECFLSQVLTVGIAPPQLFFESESSLRNPAPRRQRQEELAPPLKKGFGDGRGSDDPLCWWDGGQLSQTADAVLYKKQTMPEKNRFPACFEGEHVRFLMPEEWELLQGFPWGYTDVPGALASDRYKALGNSFPVPVIRWLGERIQFVESL